MSDRLSESCRTTLREWSAPSRVQADLRTVFLDHLATRSSGWSRDCNGAHLTASSLICVPTQRRVLLTLHAKLGRWLQTGGHLEPGDATLEAAALREAREESGLVGLALDPEPLALSRHEVPCGPVRPCFHLDVQFLVRTEDAAAPILGAESRDVAWFDHRRLPAVDDSVLALVTAAADRLDWPVPAQPGSSQTGMPW